MLFRQSLTPYTGNENIGLLQAPIRLIYMRVAYQSCVTIIPLLFVQVEQFFPTQFSS